MKIQREREQNGQPTLSDQELSAALSVRPERWAAAMESHGASQVLDLNASPVEPTNAGNDDEQLLWLKSVLQQVEGMPGKVLKAHLIEGQSIKDLAQALNCSRSNLQLHLNEGLALLRQWALRDGLMASQSR